MTSRIGGRLDGAIRRGPRLAVTLDGSAIEAYEGESVAAAMIAAGERTCRTTAKAAAPRGIFCGIGLCHDCVMTVDGLPDVRTCRTPVRDGMAVLTQRGDGEFGLAASRDASSRAPTGAASRTAAPSAHRKVVVVGGGPAGLSAAIAVATAGVPCTLIDDAPSLGGQIYRQPPSEFAIDDPAALGPDFAKGRNLRAELASMGDRVEVLRGASTLDLRGRTLLVALGDGTTTSIEADRVVLATGARDRPVPFPGWTLPGVVTAGGVQALVKSMRVRPGRRAVVAGTGPLLLVVANQLSACGVEVLAVLEAGRPRFTLGAARRVWREPGLLAAAWKYWRGLRKAGIPLLYNHAVRAATGSTSVERVRYGPVDEADWRPIASGTVEVEADLLVAGYGFVPNVELAILAGCRVEHRVDVGGWTPARDAWMRTSAPGVYAAGDGAGVAGALVAAAEGTVAGIAAVQDLGAMSERAARRAAGPSMRRLRSLARARSVLDEISRIRPGLLELVTPDTVVCRCEEVSAAAIRAALAEGARDLQAVKLLTRAGMGPCQGRNCDPSMACLVGAALGISPEAAGRIEPRPPVRAVTLGELSNRRSLGEHAAGVGP